MLPPKEEGEAAHLLYPENFTPTQKSVSNFDQQEFQSPSTKQTSECTVESMKHTEDGSDSDSPESPKGDTCTSVVIIDHETHSTTDKDASSPSNEIEIVQVLKSLENDKTPEPTEMDNSIVRASFVDFTADDEISSSHNGRPLEEESGEDEDSKEFSLTLNPDLPKIRAQQIQNWLEFEKDQDLSHDMNNNIPDSATSSMLEDSIEKPVNISQDFDLDSLSEAGQINTLTEEADSMGRRVRFLTDAVGNILISVYLTKLVHLILSILKLATAGLLDFHSSKPPSSATPSVVDTLALASFGLSSSTTSDSSSVGDYDISDYQDFSCHYNETDDIPNAISGDGEEMVQHQVMPQSQTNGHEGPIPQVIESQTEELININENPEEITIHAVNGTSPEAYDLINSETPVRVIDEVKKVIRVDPVLSLKELEDGEEDTGSDTETLSTSSCSSMIEVIPREKQGDIQFIKDDEDGDGLDENNNNELMKVTYLEDPEIKDKSITCYEFQSEKEVIALDIPADNRIDSDAPEIDYHNQDVEDFSSKETTLTAQSVDNGDKTSGEVASSLLVQISSDDKKQTVDLLKFNPIIEQDQAKYVNNVTTVDVNNNSNGGYNDFTEAHYDISEDQDPEKQLVSLCIEEEPISAVALTIAKWESFSKKQKQMKQSDRSSIITKGKVHLQSYTNNPNINVTTTMMNSTNVSTNGQGKGMQTNFSCSGKAVQLPSPSSASNSQQITASVSANNNSNTANPNNNKTAPGWNCWTNNNNNNKTNENKTIQDDEEAIYAQPNSQAGSITTSLANPSTILKGYPKPNSRGEIINWFKEGEIHRSGILLSYGQTNHHSHPGNHQTVTSPVIVSWFFGLITRQQAEELLHGQPTGTFLVRISTRIWGYTLSYQSNNKTKHFLISAINPAVAATITAGVESSNEGHNGNSGNSPPQQTSAGKKQLLFPFSPGGRYAFIGTNMTPYTTLTSLIRHHSHAPITKAGVERLIIPCPGGPKIAGIEYVFK